MTGEDGTGLPFEERRARLAEAVEGRESDGALVAHPPNLLYLTGFSGSAGLLLLHGGEALLLVDGRYREQAREEVDGAVRVRETDAGRLEALEAALGELPSGARLAFEAEHTTVTGRERLEEHGADVEWTAAEDLVEELRARKDAGELARVEAAVSAVERAWAALRDVLEVGITEREGAAEMDYRLRLEGTGPPAFDTIVAFGERTALPHARPGDRRLREGDLVLVDAGATCHGYRSDLTRMATAGPASAWQRRLHGAVDAARAAAVDAVEDGRPAREVDAAARESLRSRELAEAFTHSTGHGVGLEVHEGPSLSSRSEEILREGNVVTIEPGVYLRGRGGLRIEDDVAVEPGGGRLLTSADRALAEL